MGGHGHNEGNPNNFQETDEDMPLKIRPIDLIKYNPNMFHLWIYNPANVMNILGGGKTEVSALVGGLFGYWYYQQRLRSVPATFYARIMHTTARVVAGALVGTTVGYLKFGDRQRLHNAFVAERLRRRYPDALELDTQNLWKFKGVKPHHHFYKWT